jgi:hypothetical protein
MFSMNFLRVRKTKILNFKSTRPFLSLFFVRAARELLRPCSLELEGVGIHDSEDRRIFSDLSQISILLEHGFNVRAK